MIYYILIYGIDCLQQTQLYESVSAHHYWCTLLEHPIAASAHGSAPIESVERDHIVVGF